MKQLFAARNKLRECSFQKFAEYLQKNKLNLTSIDYINLLQQSYNLYKKEFLDYIRLFHKYFHDIVFSELDNGKRKLTVLQEVLGYRKAWELQDLINIDHRILKDFTLHALTCAVNNIYNQKDPKNGYQLVRMIIDQKPDIILDTIYDDRNNPLIEAIKHELYDIAALLLEYECYVIAPKNYCSNQFHYLFSNRTSKKNHARLIQLSKLLINRKVDIYQKNENGKPAVDLANHELKQEILKIYNLSKPMKSYNNNGGNMKINEKYTNSQTNNNNASNTSNKQYTNTNNRPTKAQKANKDNSSQGHSVSTGSNKYKGKVKSEFGGKEIIRQNNQLLRINIQNNNIAYKDSSNNIKDTDVVKVLNYDELQNEASMVFQRHTLKKQEQYVSQRAEYEREVREKKERQPRIVQSEELKYYLREEILCLTNTIKLTNDCQKPGYTKIFEEIKNRLQSKISVITVDIFGSFATNLHLDLSDIDIVIIAKDNLQQSDYKSHQRTIHEIFQTVCNELKEMTEFIQEANYLDKASIPIIKATCKKEYDFKNIDISFQDEQHKGIESVELIRQYLVVYPELTNLMLVLKKFIYETKLFSPYSGGLSSYGLFLMIVALIQHEDVRNPVDRNHPQYDMHLRTAQLLFGFLKFYGFKMDYVTEKIGVTRPDNLHNLTKPVVYNTEWQNQFPPQPKLIVMDPLYEENNVGKATRRIKEIKMAFELAFIAIHTNKRCKQKKTCESYRRIKAVKMEEIRFKENKRPCCILERMFRATDMFNLHEY